MSEITKRGDIMFLFDVDGTLSPSRQKAPPMIIDMLKELKKRVCIAFVGGSDLPKQIEQVGPDLLEIFDYGFPENGVISYENGKMVSSESIIEFLGEEKYVTFVNKVLKILSEVRCPFKRGVFIELRKSMINVSPVGRSCTVEERNKFGEFDKKENVRKKICDDVRGTCVDLGLQASIGGQISIDFFPKGWDKTYCLRHVKQGKIIFFGDMTMEGGNDYEIFNHERVNGTTITGGPDDTFKKVNERLKELGIEEISL